MPQTPDPNDISRKKQHYPVTPPLAHYLRAYDRAAPLPITYQDLLHYTDAYPLFDRWGQDTLWQTVIYDQGQMQEIYEGLTRIYVQLKSDGNESLMEQLSVQRVDYCTFGNSNPFRIRIVNLLNDNYDYFYFKKADASRIYGLELEHVLSPNRINYLVHGASLIEEHIAGIPGDEFIKHYLSRPNLNKVRLAKEFVKFNERCFALLLGDMRSYNYVVVVTPDFEEEQYRVRPIDFDQQSYEGRKTMYLPQYFKDNNPIVALCTRWLQPETMKQYQNEERTLLFRRIRAARYRLKDLIDCMRQDTISTQEKVGQLREELARHHQLDDFRQCDSMGDLVRLQLKIMVRHL
ncbi:hypothetical protein ACD591_02885 [Rufibacter glacialis]|uniref:Uncharacterized protein n=1 Tax=Rufibacter glacialis TaxID=1259555 RepID=A0A5M8QLH4_9BACT|nr:hypothetical protein [Rufibacter glacialis]KAA6435824.1 hypothetical protein FOE74_07790 [Rufibacter glacialis]GGK66893.1 hypothetical protein GCM10011405_13560 [Rufibacter glacialis]